LLHAWAQNDHAKYDAVTNPAGYIDPEKADAAFKAGLSPTSFPASRLLEEPLERNASEMYRSDGVSSYSAQWWQAWAEGKATTQQAVNETLAEMARIKHETGHLPEVQPSLAFKAALAKTYGELVDKTDKYVNGKGYVRVSLLPIGRKAWKDLFRGVQELGKTKGFPSLRSPASAPKPKGTA
jgi:hypothetical protein